jgi:hypothetical protein
VAKRLTIIVSALSLLLATSAPSKANEYLVNGGFETGDLTGWTNSGNTGFTGVTTGFDGYGPQSGNYFLYAGPIGSLGTLSQSFNDVAGQQLVVSGWVAGNGTGPSEVAFMFNGITYVDINPVPNQPYTQYSFNVTGTGNDTFAVGFRNDPNYDALDSFSVATAAPEPATWAMMILGFLGVGLLAHRRRGSTLRIA